MLRKMGLIICFLLISVPAFAVPVLQVGAPGPPGTYADYQASLTNPTETYTAITSGTTLFVAGVYGNNVLNLGAQFDGVVNWSSKGFDSIFNSYGAVLMATVPDGSLGNGSLLVNGNNPFYTTGTYENGFIVPNPPANHAPIQGQDYLFFDIGNFLKISNAVPNFDSESGAADGEIKTLTISISGYDWVHFDAMALETSQKTGKPVVTAVVGNPGSADVTWETQPVPEPATMFLLGSGLIGMGAFVRRKFKR